METVFGVKSWGGEGGGRKRKGMHVGLKMKMVVMMGMMACAVGSVHADVMHGGGKNVWEGKKSVFFSASDDAKTVKEGWRAEAEAGILRGSAARRFVSFSHDAWSRRMRGGGHASETKDHLVGALAVKRMRPPDAARIREMRRGFGAVSGAEKTGNGGAVFAVRVDVDEEDGNLHSSNTRSGPAHQSSSNSSGGNAEDDGGNGVAGTRTGLAGEWVVIGDNDDDDDGDDLAMPRGLVWRSRLQSPGAASLTVAFSHTKLPSNAILCISDAASGAALYIAQGAALRGGGKHLAAPVPSDDILVEIFIPFEKWEVRDDDGFDSDNAAILQLSSQESPSLSSTMATMTMKKPASSSSSEVMELAHALGADSVLNLMRVKVDVVIDRVMHGWKNASAEPQQSGSCNRNVNCSGLAAAASTTTTTSDRIKRSGSGWDAPPESDSVVQILSAGEDSATWCTGTLIHSLDKPGRQLVLTAAHCLWSSINNPLGQQFWGFVFGFEVVSCQRTFAVTGTPTTDEGDYLQGSIVQFFDYETDIAVVELTSDIPASFEPYFAGWDARPKLNVAQAVSIHHPSGDPKKISFDEEAPVPGCWCGNACSCPLPTHWIVEAWDVGTTERGSSGAPLFDVATRRVIGTLTGGAASCSNKEEADAFGMLSVAFTKSARLRKLLVGDTDNSFADGVAAPRERFVNRNFQWRQPGRGDAVEALGIFEIDLVPDLFPDEILWTLTDPSGDNIASGVGTDIKQTRGPFEGEMFMPFSPVFLLEPGTYTFTIFDLGGDGICCLYETGKYNLLVNGMIVYSSPGIYQYEESFSFEVSPNREPKTYTLLPDAFYGDVIVDITVFQRQEEIYWALIGPTKLIYAAGHMGGVTTIPLYRCGEFVFIIRDAEGDGIARNESYSVRVNGKRIFGGNNFRSSQVSTFFVPCQALDTEEDNEDSVAAPDVASSSTRGNASISVDEDEKERESRGICKAEDEECSISRSQCCSPLSCRIVATGSGYATVCAE